MPRGLGGRIALAFAGLSLAVLVAVGGTLFVVLRGLHQASSQDALANVSVGLAIQRTRALVSANAQETLLAIRDGLAQRDISVGLVLADGSITSLEGDAPLALGSPRLDLSGARGATHKGTFAAPDGTAYDYAVTILRPAAGVGPRALAVATPDRSRAQALSDLLTTLPAVALVLLLVGLPIGWLLVRSVVRPLDRLATATAEVPAAPGGAATPPLPIQGPAEVRELTERFNSMRAELAASRQREGELLANLRHDLRTPLTVIGGFATALADGTASGEARERAARAIVEETERLERLVGELAAMERLRAGPAGLRPEELDAHALVAATAERFAPQAAARGVTVEALPSDGAPLRLAADRLAIERMLANLVDNALASLGTEPAAGGGHVWLAAGALPAAAGEPSRVAFSVTDDGPGFPPGSAPRVFERFYRADPARSGPGSGLGLAIVRELARAHGGDAIAENVAPRGARVTVVLPTLPSGAPLPSTPTI